MEQVRSSDGTSIAFDRSGDGPPVILVVGAFNDRGTGAPLAEVLARRFTVLNYDRRGRGASGDTAPYAVEREIEDLGALIGAAGGTASVFGYSSGAVLALKAAAQGLPITRLALYEPPLAVEGAGPGPSVDHSARLTDLVAAGRRGEAVEYFQGQMVGLPDAVVASLRHAPFRPALEKMAHTLVYEALITAPMERVPSVAVPTLVIAGEASPPPLRAMAQGVADGLPDGRICILEGQTHDLVPAVLGPVLEAFFAA